jgi:hypothetical protein
MDIYGKIREKISKMGAAGKVTAFPAQVVSVDGETCSVRIDDLTVTGVRLRAVINGDKDRLLVTPKVGSYVLAVDLSGGDYRSLAVVSVSEIDSVTFERGGQNLFDVMSDFIDEVAKIIVVQGTSPNVPALMQIKARLNTLIK